MKNKSKIVTYILAGILLFLVIFLYMQIQYDKKRTTLPNNANNINIENTEDTSIEPIIENNILASSEIKKDETKNSTLVEDENSFNIISNKDYNLDDKIPINELSKNSTYDINASTVSIKSGELQTYNIDIKSYKFNVDDYTLDFDIEMYATTLNSEYDLDTNNFQMYYGDTLLDNLTIANYTIGKNPTEIKLSFKFDENISIGDINTTFFRFKYMDDFNLRNINIY